jgi:hypothetical protein
MMKKAMQARSTTPPEPCSGPILIEKITTHAEIAEMAELSGGTQRVNEFLGTL